MLLLLVMALLTAFLVATLVLSRTTGENAWTLLAEIPTDRAGSLVTALAAAGIRARTRSGAAPSTRRILVRAGELARARSTLERQTAAPPV